MAFVRKQIVSHDTMHDVLKLKTNNTETGFPGPVKSVAVIAHVFDFTLRLTADLQFIAVKWLFILFWELSLCL